MIHPDTLHAPARELASGRRSAAALLWRCVLLLGIAALPVAFSAVVDPARLVASRRAEGEIVGALLAGHDVTDVTNYDDRVIHRELALARRAPVDVLALGSSRVQPLGAAAFPSARTFANSGVSGGSLDDVLAMYEPWDDAVRRPRRVVLEVDPWLLGAEDPAAAWSAVADARARMLDRLGVPNSLALDRARLVVRTVKRLAAPEYFRLSVFSLRHHGLRGIPFAITDREQNTEKTMRPDGSLAWMPVTPNEAQSLARQYLAAEITGDPRYVGLDRARSARAEHVLEALVLRMRSQGSETSILLVPYHPATWAAFARRSPSPLAEAERRFRGIAMRAGVQVVGRYDPARCGARAEDFFDESHARPALLARVIAGACER